MKIDLMSSGISIFRMQDGYLVSLYLDVGDPYYSIFNKGINELTHRTKRKTVCSVEEQCSTCRFWAKLKVGPDGRCKQMGVLTGPGYTCADWERQV